MRRFRSTYLAMLVILTSLMGPWAANPSEANAADCRFVLGFKDVHDAIADIVGECKANEHYNPENGDALQETTNGLLVWRKSDNFTAFTDGYRTWVNGPYGMQQRLNTERFDWEPADPQAIALNLNDMPTGFSAVPSANKYTSNESSIKGSKNPAETAAYYQKWGRVNGYISSFDQLNAAGIRGTLMVTNDIDIFHSPEGAHTAFGEWEGLMSRNFKLSPVSAPAIGEESKAFMSNTTIGNDANKTSVTLYFMVFRKASVLSAVATFSLTSAANFDDAINYSRVVEARIK